MKAVSVVRTATIKRQTEFIHKIHPCLSVTASVIAWTVQKTVDSVLTGQSDGCLAF